MNNKTWHKIFNNKSFSYNADSKFKIKNSSYQKISYSLLKIVHPELNYKKYKNILKFISKNLIIKKKQSLVDFGSGNGAMLLYFKRKFFSQKKL